MRFLNNAAARATACWKLKVRLSVGLTILFLVPYFTVQHVFLFPIRTLETTPIDDAIAFEPRWVWAYQSVYLLIACVPWLAIRREHLIRYARGFVLLSFAGFLCFLLFPIAAPRPEVLPTTGMMSWVVWYDGLTNTMPSLHVGLAAYTVFFAATISEGATTSTRWRLIAVGALWSAAIAYAALATKQHYAVDLPPGVLIAWLAHRWSWRDRHALDRSAVLDAHAIGEAGR